MNHKVASCLSDSYLRKYLRLLEKHCPDTLHVWMPQFDGRRTSSATYDLVSGTALNLGTGAAFSGDGKRIVLDSGETASGTLTSRPYIYQAFVIKLADETSAMWPVAQNPKNMQVHYQVGASYYQFMGIWSADGSTDNWTVAKTGWNTTGFGFAAVEFVANSVEMIARSPQEDFHSDVAGSALYAVASMSLSLRGGAEFAAYIYGGATTSAPLESLASVVKRGESGALLTEMFRELI